MKVGIVTVHNANNYGAALQAYALQKTLLNLGAEPYFINYTSSFLKHPFGIENFRKKGIVGELFTLAGEISRLPRRKGFSNFRKEHFRCTEELNKNDLKDIEKSFDLFIAGSDQVWNYKITNFDGAYLLDFVQDNNKKGSYAASFGMSQINDEYTEWYTDKLKGYKFINIREKSAIHLVEKYAGITPNVVLDPTLLIDREEWIKIAKPSKFNGEYILSYQVGKDKKLINYIRDLSKKTGLPIYSIPMPQGGFVKSHCLLSCDPLEWLGWINGAKYIVTDSFHGLALSIIFNKNVIVNITTLGKSLSSRQMDLMNELGIKNRRIEDMTKIVPSEIDYIEVNKKLKKLQNKSLTVLKEMLDASKVKN